MRRHHSRLTATIDVPGTLVVWRDESGTEHARTWPRALPGHRSGCRIDASKGLRQHRCSEAHRTLVDGYRAWREHEERQAEAESIGYATEETDYWQTHTRPTFRTYLLAQRQEHDTAA